MSEQYIELTSIGLLKSTIISILLAAFLSILFVLPAEYGIDPTGFGQAIGINNLAGESEHSTAAKPDETGAQEIEFNNNIETEEDEEADTPFPKGIANVHDTDPSNHKFTITLKPLDEVEYKAVLNAGEPLFYRWSVVGGENVYVDFHGDPTEGTFPDEYFQSYEEGEIPKSQGSFSATFTGNHGWYWLNISDHNITIELEAWGYYQSLTEIFRGNQRDKYK